MGGELAAYITKKWSGLSALSDDGCARESTGEARLNDLGTELLVAFIDITVDKVGIEEGAILLVPIDLLLRVGKASLQPLFGLSATETKAAFQVSKGRSLNEHNE